MKMYVTTGIDGAIESVLTEEEAKPRSFGYHYWVKVGEGYWTKKVCNRDWKWFLTGGEKAKKEWDKAKEGDKGVHVFRKYLVDSSAIDKALRPLLPRPQ